MKREYNVKAKKKKKGIVETNLIQTLDFGH